MLAYHLSTPLMQRLFDVAELSSSESTSHLLCTDLDYEASWVYRGSFVFRDDLFSKVYPVHNGRWDHWDYAALFPTVTSYNKWSVFIPCFPHASIWQLR